MKLPNPFISENPKTVEEKLLGSKVLKPVYQISSLHSTEFCEIENSRKIYTKEETIKALQPGISAQIIMEDYIMIQCNNSRDIYSN